MLEPENPMRANAHPMSEYSPSICFALPRSFRPKFSTMAGILLVEDDEYFRAVTRATLSEGGHSVAEAADGRAAVRAVKEGAFDVVIVDLLLPQKDGFEVIRELKRDFPSVKIVAMSGGGKYADKHEYLRIARHLGAADTLVKPFAPDALLSAVARVSSA